MAQSSDIEGALAVELGPAIGQGTIEVPVRLVNTYKASVPGTQLEVSVEGPSATLMESTVTLDAHGQGLLGRNHWARSLYGERHRLIR